MRRPLWETMIELAESAAAGADSPTHLHITGMVVDIPVELRLHRTGSNEEPWELFGDVPGWRWQTGMEELRSRLRIDWTT